MKKSFIIITTAFSFLLSSNISAEPQEVAKASEASTNAARNEKWKKWGIAIGTILIAATGITIIAVNKGTPAKQQH